MAIDRVGNKTQRLTILAAAFALLAAMVTSLGAQAQTSFTLTTMLSSGVVANLASGNATYSPGSTVQYAVSAASGYSSAVVVIDGSVAATSGTISMDANHYIWAFGNPSGGTAFNAMTTAPTEEINLLPYPEFYVNPPSISVAVNAPYCTIQSDTVAFPTSYLGAFPLPPVFGAPMPGTVNFGVGLQDQYLPVSATDPTLNAGCSGSIQDAISTTLARIKALGADHVSIWNDFSVVNVNAVPLQIETGELNMSIPPDYEASIVQQAHSLGLKVYEFAQVSPFDEQNQPFPTNPTQAWLSNFLNMWTSYVASRGAVAQANGVDAFDVDWRGWYFDWTPYRPMFIAGLIQAAQQARAVFSGKLILGLTEPFISNDPTLLSNVDWFLGDLISPTQINSTQNNNVSVSLMEPIYANWITQYAKVVGPNGPPILWQIGTESHRNALCNTCTNGGYIDDNVGCTANATSNCLQQTVQTDFSVQAIATEASLEAIAAQTSATTVGVDYISYRYDDVILPGPNDSESAFPNIGLSARDKPAEAVLYQWFNAAPSPLVAAVLPASRSAMVGNTVTAFATMINTASTSASQCAIAPNSILPLNLTYQATNPTTNALVGTANTPVNIPGNDGSQSFVIAVSPTEPFNPADVAFTFSCANMQPATVSVGIDTLNLSASFTPVPDIVALAASADPGYLDVSAATNIGDFAVATVNLGVDSTITAAANTGSATLPLTLAICQTNPSTGACLAAPATSVSTDIQPNATPTFAIFATGSGTIADSPGANRVFVTFTDSGGTLRGETSVAVRTH
jgi:hypothetical protein